MKLGLILKLPDESNTQAPIGLCLDAELPDFAQICLRRFRTVVFSLAFKGRIAALKGVSHYEIEVPILELRQCATGGLHQRRSRK